MDKKNGYVMGCGLLMLSACIQATEPVVKESAIESVIESVLEVIESDVEIIQAGLEVVQNEFAELQSGLDQLNNQPMPPCCIDPHDANINWWNNPNYAQYAVTTAVVLPLIGWLSNNSFSSFYSSNTGGVHNTTIPKP